MPNYYPIDERTARTAHCMVNMSDYIPGSCTAQYRAAVDEAATLVESRKSKVSPYYHEKLDGILDTYARRLAQWHNDYNRNQAAYPSQFISGSGGYDLRKHNKQMVRENSLWEEYEEINALLNKIKSIGTGPVDLEDPNARGILNHQLHKEQEALDRCKALNAWYRKHNTFDGFPELSKDAAAALSAKFSETRAKCPWITKPCPDYELTSIRGKIKRIQERLSELDKLEAAAASPSDSILFSGGKIVKNAQLNRLQIIFNSIPDSDTRERLKHHGFRWSPSSKAWQRKLTENALRDARKILDLL